MAFLKIQMTREVNCKGGVAPSTRFHLRNDTCLRKPQLLPARNLRFSDPLLSRKQSTVIGKKTSLQYLYKITLENGEHYDVSKDQKLVLKDVRHDDYPFYMSVEDCLKLPFDVFQYYRVTKGRTYWANHEVFIDPFLLGCWLGSRMCDRSGFCTSRRKYRDVSNWLKLLSIDHTFSPLSNYVNVSYSNNKSNLRDNISRYNLDYNNKFVPREYKYNDVQTRISLLRGFLLTSECFTRGYKTILRFDNLALAYDIVYVARSLGYKAHINRNRIVFNIIPSQNYRFSIKPLGLGECVTLTCNQGVDTILTEDFDEILIG